MRTNLRNVPASRRLLPRRGDQPSMIIAKVVLIVLVLLVLLIVCGVFWTIWWVWNIPSVPDRVLPTPQGAVVASDWTRPGAEDGYGAQREVAFQSSTLDGPELLDAVVEEMTRAGWQLELGEVPGNAGVHWHSIEDLDGEYDLVLWESPATEHPPTGATDSWMPGRPTVRAVVDTLPDPGP